MVASAMQLASKWGKQMICLGTVSSCNRQRAQHRQDGPLTKRKAQADDVVTIKKYANRRLYNTATSSYVTLDHLSQMVKEGTEFNVYDAKTGEDITRSVLTQIIFEEESKGQNLLPIRFLRQLIPFYGDSLQSFVPKYLEMSMESFEKNREEMRSRLVETFGPSAGLKAIEDHVRNNIALFEKTLRMFSPFPNGAAEKEPDEKSSLNGRQSSAEEQPPAESEIADLRKQLESMQKQLDAIVQEKN